MNTDGIDSEKDPVLESALREFRSSALAGIERPEQFWLDQREAVMSRVVHRSTSAPFKPILAWGVVVAIALMMIGVWVEVSRALPAPDFAAGYDQDLLGDVDRMVDAEVPWALEPALLLADEIRAGKSQGRATYSADSYKR